MKISTIAVHGGLTDTSHYAAAFPVYLTSTFIQKGPTEFREYGYSRTANPTRSDVEKHAADIEGAKHGIAIPQKACSSKCIESVCFLLKAHQCSKKEITCTNAVLSSLHLPVSPA